jgi:hypothetical protein
VVTPCECGNVVDKPEVHAAIVLIVNVRRVAEFVGVCVCVFRFGKVTGWREVAHNAAV